MQGTKTLNGLDTAQMYETIAAIKKQPAIAKFQWSAKNEWIGGGENRSTIRDFYGACQEDTDDCSFGAVVMKFGSTETACLTSSPDAAMSFRSASTGHLTWRFETTHSAKATRL